MLQSPPNDKADLSTLLQPHIEPLYRLAWRWTQHRHDAEDLVQDVLTRLLSCPAELYRVERLRPWLIKVLYRRYVDLYRRRVRSPIDSEGYWIADLEILDHYSGDFPNTTGEVKQLELRQLLARGLEKLDDDQRDVLILHDVEGYTASEVAHVLDINVGTVKSRLHRARQKLKRFIPDGTL